MDDNFHDFHIHGHRWKDAAGAFVDTPTVGPNETITARFVEDNPGRWLYHCHVFSHQDAGHGGLVPGEPLRRRNDRVMRFRTAAVAALATALLATGRRARADPRAELSRSPRTPARSWPAPKGKGKTRTVCKRGCKFKTIQAAVNKSKKGDTVRVKNGTYREAVKVTGAKRATSS